MGIFLALAKLILPGFLKDLLGIGAQAVKEAQTRADEIDLGQERQARVDQAGAIAAGQRMDKAGAAPRDDATTKGRLDDGTF